MINRLIQILKRIVSLLLINNFTGELISRIKSDKLYCYSLIVDTSNPVISSTVKAALFFNKYESAESRFIIKYLYTDHDVIELGASIGISSCLIRRKLNTDKKVISVEANQALIDTITKNIQNNKLNYNFFLLNKAISYDISDTKKVSFRKQEDTLLGKIIHVNQSTPIPGNTWVDTIKFVDIINEYQIKDYSLVCDIEGSEIELFLNENECLKNCKQIIIETHTTSYRDINYKFSELAELIRSRHNFKLIDSYGPVYVFNSF